MADLLRRPTPCSGSKELRHCCAVLGGMGRTGAGDVAALPGRCLGICICGGAEDQTWHLLCVSKQTLSHWSLDLLGPLVLPSGTVCMNVENPSVQGFAGGCGGWQAWAVSVASLICFSLRGILFPA